MDDACLTGSAELIVTGRLHGTVVIDGVTLASPDELASLLLRFDPDGSLIHGLVFPAESDGCPLGCTVAPDDSVVVGAVCVGTVDFGAGPQGEPAASTGQLAALSADGTLRYSRTLGGPGLDRLVLATSPTGALVKGRRAARRPGSSCRQAG